MQKFRLSLTLEKVKPFYKALESSSGRIKLPKRKESYPPVPRWDAGSRIKILCWEAGCPFLSTWETAYGKSYRSKVLIATSGNGMKNGKSRVSRQPIPHQSGIESILAETG